MIRIRSAQQGDSPLLAEVFRMAALASYPELAQLGKLTLAERLEGISASYEGPERRCFVAEDAEGAPLGAVWATLGIHPVLEIPEAVIIAIGVREPARGRGVGRALLDHAHQALRAEGARSIRLFVHPQNAQALSLYRNLGYQDGLIELTFSNQIL